MAFDHSMPENRRSEVCQLRRPNQQLERTAEKRSRSAAGR